MKTATEIRRLKDFTGDARLFQLSEPMPWDYDWETEQNKALTSFVVVSAASMMFSGPETYIFPANEAGEVINWGELEGSYRGGLSHRAALLNAGYVISDK